MGTSAEMVTQPKEVVPRDVGKVPQLALVLIVRREVTLHTMEIGPVSPGKSRTAPTIQITYHELVQVFLPEVQVIHSKPRAW